MQKISPFLWFNNNAEEAINTYTSIFPNSRIVSVKRHPDEPLQGMAEGLGMEGKILTGVFELAGQQFMALDGGDYFKFTPAVSFFVNCDDEAEIDAFWSKLSDGGETLMPLQAYDFSPKFGWLKDKYGVSWQFTIGESKQKITPFLMFVGDQYGKAEEALNFYKSLFPDSSVGHLERYAEGELGGERGTVKRAVFTLHGQEFMAIDSNFNHDFTFTEATSFYVDCADQAEVDDLWDKLSAVPESETCGWLKDKFGVSWQIIPRQLITLMNDSDPVKAKRVMDTMLQMHKIDVAELERAYAG
jgi:predicted 3-demethylubiquinone-9 3-methyltransferase (glyoxalase superfamily)